MIEPMVLKVAGCVLSAALGVCGFMQITCAIPKPTDLGTAVKQLEDATALIHSAAENLKKHAGNAHAEASVTIHQTSIFDAYAQELQRAKQWEDANHEQ
jgi:hypothetical protein